MRTRRHGLTFILSMGKSMKVGIVSLPQKALPIPITHSDSMVQQQVLVALAKLSSWE